jgi:CBS domain-containing protein
MDRKIKQVIEGRGVHSMSKATTVQEAARHMAAQRIGALLVVEGGSLVGIFTERDALSRVLAKGVDPARTTLGDVMTPKPITISSDKPLSHALIFMHENGFRHMPVVDGGRILGVVSVRDALGSELSELDSNLVAMEEMAENIR